MARRILMFTVIAEFGTGIALLIAPVQMVAWLLGAPLVGAGIAATRCFGIALLALALACWPGRRADDADPRSARAMLAYNALVALYLAYLGVVGHAWGILLWPAVLLHAAVAVALVLAPRHRPVDAEMET